MEFVLGHEAVLALSVPPAVPKTAATITPGALRVAVLAIFRTPTQAANLLARMVADPAGFAAFVDHSADGARTEGSRATLH